MGFLQSLKASRHGRSSRARHVQRRRAKLLSACPIELLEQRRLLTAVGPEPVPGFAYTQNIATAPAMADSNAMINYIESYYQGKNTTGYNAPNDFGVNFDVSAPLINMVHGNGTSSQVAWTPLTTYNVQTGSINGSVTVPFPKNPDGSLDLTLEG